MSGGPLQSWGRIDFGPQRGVAYRNRTDSLPDAGGATLLPYGLGRSYGDSCLNTGGALVECRFIDRFIDFDPATGVLRCEAGTPLADLLAVGVPRGWFLPATPGTKFITVGGAIANDVHGKNHHRAGTFGRHVRRFELLRSDGQRFECSPELNPEWFAATVGGLGLTGLITWAEIQMKPVPGPTVAQEAIRFGKLDEFFALSRESDAEFEYTVAWIDCLDKDGRGVFLRGNHAEGRVSPPRARPAMPFTPPVSLVNGLSLRLFNEVYWRARSARKHTRVHYERYFYPLDAIGGWNRIYGRRGFFQYQCVLPASHAEGGVRDMLRRIAADGDGSFLVVLKMFGDVPSPGLMSFPRPGVTLALDFANRGRRTLTLLERLDEVTRGAGGAVYPAKDARMSAESFRQYFPQWERLRAFQDPKFSSSFWRRVTEA
jgi:FAD/FMN-containing dehydrogenase